MNNQSEQHVQQVQLRKFAIEEWCQGKGMGSLLLEHAKTIALKRCQNLAANKEKKNYDEGGEDGNDNLSLSGTKHKYILWLDARVHQVPFYEHRGFIMVGEPFEKYGKLYARMEHILIQNNNQEEVQVDSINNNHIDHIERNDSNTNVTQSPLTRRLPYENSSFVDKEILNDQVYQVIGSIDVMCMGVESIRQWLLTINKQVGRGSEFRKALELIRGAKVNNASSSDERALPEEGCLTWEDFKTIYIEEMNQGKFWGVAWDMNECGFPLADLESPSSSSNQSLSSSSSSTTQSANSNNRFLARYDRAFVRSGKIRAVRETLAAGITEYPLLPNAHHPSDHLPIALSVELC
jgi:hypothetical protein